MSSAYPNIPRAKAARERVGLTPNISQVPTSPRQQPQSQGAAGTWEFVSRLASCRCFHLQVVCLSLLVCAATAKTINLPRLPDLQEHLSVSETAAARSLGIKEQGFRVAAQLTGRAAPRRCITDNTNRDNERIATQRPATAATPCRPAWEPPIGPAFSPTYCVPWAVFFCGPPPTPSPVSGCWLRPEGRRF
jgi:hypothetical protein